MLIQINYSYLGYGVGFDSCSFDWGKNVVVSEAGNISSVHIDTKKRYLSFKMKVQYKD